MTERRKTVLIVDSDDAIRERLAAVLKHDYRVLKTASGESALSIMSKEDVDILLIDVRLPGIGGFELLKIVKENYGQVEAIVTAAGRELDTAI